MTKEDRDYIMAAIRYMFPTVQLTAEDIESSWAGVRPLIYEEGKNASEISRRDEIWQSPSGLITIAGGKLTGYRKMAEMIVDLVMQLLSREAGQVFVPTMTKKLPISGGQVGGSEAFSDFVQKKTEEGVHRGLDGELAKRWARHYGSNADRIFEIADRCRMEGEASGLPLEVLVPLLYAIEEEMTVKPVDFFIRRTGALFFNIQWVRDWKEPVIEYMASVFGWTTEQRDQYTEELNTALHQAVVPQMEGTLS
jgi:glycerol-3-phosphate dehydrogenase